MNLDDLMGYIVTILLFVFVDSIIIYSNYKSWIKQKSLEDVLYKWKGTNKSKKWFILWTSFVAMNIVITVILPLFYMNMDGIRLAFFIAGPYTYFLGIIYIIVKNYVRYYHDKDDSSK